VEHTDASRSELKSLRRACLICACVGSHKLASLFEPQRAYNLVAGFATFVSRWVHASCRSLWGVDIE
jgi:hypothetical protein